MRKSVAFIAPLLLAASPMLAAVNRHERIPPSPILFEPNLGQAPANAMFVAQSRGFRLLLEPHAAVFDFGQTQARLEFSGTAPKATSLHGESRSATFRNYLKGADANRWLQGIPTFEKVRYRNLLQGVDAVFYAKQDLEFDLVLAPGADPNLIELRYTGFQSINLEANGDLTFGTSQGVLRQRLPDVFQDGHSVRARYVRRGSNVVGIEVSRYDVSRPLIIDPRISYATYVGGAAVDAGSGVAVDASGNYYLAAYTSSLDYPRLPASQTFAGDLDIVVSKFSPANALIYSTVIGGSGADIAYAAVADADGNLFVSFGTTSPNFPRPAGSAVGGTGPGTGVLKLNPSGIVTAVATWPLPAGNANAINAAFGLTLDSNNNVWVTGTTTGFAGQTGAIQAAPAGGQDLFVARLNNTLTQITYFTYLGTNADETATSIAVDPGGDVFIAANGGSPAFPTGNRPAFPGPGAFVVRINPTANRVVFATYLTAGAGGHLVLDGADVWAVANSSGSSFTPTQDALQRTFGGGTLDIVLVRLNTSDGQIRYATYLGGSGDDFANALAQDPYGNLIILGNTSSKNFPVSADAVQKVPGNPALSTTALIAQIDPAGGLLYSSYLGGTGNFDVGIAAAIDQLGNAILTGITSSKDFPTTAGSLQPRFGGGDTDSYLARIEFVAPADPYLPRVAVQNGASFRPGPVAPGEIITIYPTNVGPPALVTAALTADRRISTLIGGTRVLFDNIAAPLVYTVAGQISLTVPYEVQGKQFTRVVVEYNGVKSRPVVVPVTNVAPGIITISGGTGQAVVINEDKSFNAPATPADRGSIIVFFATGEGQTNPPGVNGRLNEFTNLQDFPRPELPASITIGGQPAEILFGAGAPGFLAGLLQLNVRVPAGAQPGPAVPLVFTVGGVSSPTTVTMAVR